MRRAPQQWELPLGPVGPPEESVEERATDGTGSARERRRAVDAHPLALEQNLVLSAGAGAGKTWSLVTLALHVLAGAREQGPVRPAELCMLTFTDKAAGEMRRRLRERLEKLSLDVEPGEEEEVLRASFARLGRPLPTPAEWRVLRDSVGAADVGTFHSLCVQLLRRAPAGCGVDPDFVLLEEREARELLETTAEDVILAALDAQDHQVSELVEELGFAPQGRSAGLSGELVSVLGRLREEGLGAESLALASQAEVESHFQRQVAALADAVEATRAEDGQRTLTATCDALAGLVPHLSPESFVSGGMGDRLEEVLAAADEAVRLEKQVKRPRGVKAPGPMVKRLRRLALGAEPESLESLAAAWRSAPFEVTLRRLLGSLQKEHRAALERRGALDFTELLVRTRDLLRDFPSARRAAQARARVLLVDEFQDTNRLQLELVTLLAERREGAPRALGSDLALESLPLEPAALCIVGDRKQSIYEFRGADVSVFGRAERRILEEGGRREYLQVNRRSSPPLLEFFNTSFARVMAEAPEARDYEVHFTAGDHLSAHREAAGAVAVERLDSDWPEKAEEIRQQDARVVAMRLAALLADDGPACVVDGDGVPRQARGADVAVLFRNFTSVEVYRQALLREGVPHRVVRGRGFYGAQEVLDLASFLSLVADPSDALALAAVLRSPMVGLSDASLLRVARAGDGRLGLTALTGPRLHTLGLAPQEGARVALLVRLIEGLSPEQHRLGLSALLRVVLAETDLRVLLAATPHAEQALANVDKLLELAARREAAGRGDCAAFARELRFLADAEPTEAQAEILDASDPRAVVLLTVHQSKGLEWPVVVVPDLGGRLSPPDRGRIRHDRTLGLALRPWLPQRTERFVSPRWVALKDEHARRQLAERRRLLYVALTRARDLLVLSGARAKREGTDTWDAWLEAPLEDCAALVRRLRVVPERSAPEEASREETPPAELSDTWRRALRRMEAPVRPAPARVILPVTHLQDFELCPRRYQTSRLWGLAELALPTAGTGGRTEAHSETAMGGGLGADPRASGSQAHRLLERIPLELWGASPERLAPMVAEFARTEGLDPQHPSDAALLARVERFLCSDYAARSGKRGSGLVQRELPFLLRLPDRDAGPAIFLKGTIDLLVEEEDGGVSVVDYKSGGGLHPEGLAPYRFQLACYALAAWELSGRQARVRAGISFLGAADPQPRWDGELPALGAFAHMLRERAERLLEASAQGVFPGLASARCSALHCGHLRRCHPGADA